MEINKRSRKGIKETELNPEGSKVFSRDNEIQLYLEASNLRLKEDSFYTKANTKLNSVITLAGKTDEAFVCGLAKYMANNGIKLSPVVLSSVLADKKFSFRGKGFEFIFNTPQRIAEAIALHNNDYVKLNNSFKKNCLKPALEHMKDFTLKKNKMARRSVKLKDLIKLLRPKPANDHMAKLYKAIIEDGKMSKLDSKDNFIAMKSDKDLTDKEKKDFITKNLDTIPLNQLIRNLKFIEDNFTFNKGNDLKERIIKRMNSIDNYRFLNIFDLIEASIHVKGFQKALFEVITKYCEDFKKSFDFSGEKATVLFDVSGSMGTDYAGKDGHGGIDVGFKYLVLLSLIYNCELTVFSDELHMPKNDVVKKISNGSICEAKEEMLALMKKYGGGTALIESANELLDTKEVKTLIVISDEVSWEEGDDLTGYISGLTKRLKNTKLILINPVVYKGTVFGANYLACASLTANILNDILLIEKPKAFKEFIREYGKGCIASA